MENDQLKKVIIKNCMFYYFNDWLKFKYFDSDIILFDENQYDNTLFYNISYKTLAGSKRLRISFDKII